MKIGELGPFNDELPLFTTVGKLRQMLADRPGIDDSSEVRVYSHDGYIRGWRIQQDPCGQQTLTLSDDRNRFEFGDRSELDDTKPERDPRIRHEYGDYRAVAPKGVMSGKRFFMNKTEVVLEKSVKDSLGNKSWVWVTAFGPDRDPIDGGMYTILCGDCEDV